MLDWLLNSVKIEIECLELVFFEVLFYLQIYSDYFFLLVLSQFVYCFALIGFFFIITVMNFFFIITVMGIINWILSKINTQVTIFTDGVRNRYKNRK